ncbi:MAG: hypothetical protein KAW88_07285 [Candidatus Cloacimonetes bacterium]|nr:hypothetical protein [Candidatus Cloacimonadota bacterium]
MQFECGKFFHIYTRANTNIDVLFYEDENYIFFLRKYRKYIEPIFVTLCYCLMPNHYHLLIKVKSDLELYAYQKKKNYKYAGDEIKINDFITRQFANFHISYSKAINKKYERRGSLFQSKPKAKHISDINYLIRAARYIHRNPIKHKIVKDIADWSFSSFPDYANKRNGVLTDKNFLLSNYDSVEDLLRFTYNNEDDHSDEFDKFEKGE